MRGDGERENDGSKYMLSSAKDAVACGEIEAAERGAVREREKRRTS